MIVWIAIILAVNVATGRLAQCTSDTELAPWEAFVMGVCGVFLLGTGMCSHVIRMPMLAASFAQAAAVVGYSSSDGSARAHLLGVIPQLGVTLMSWSIWALTLPDIYLDARASPATWRSKVFVAVLFGCALQVPQFFEPVCFGEHRLRGKKG